MYKTGRYLFYKEPMNLRSRPQKNAELLGTVPQGYCGSVTEVENNWGKIQVNGTWGWCCISECFAKSISDGEDEKCCYYEKYLQLKNEYERISKNMDKIREILR